MTLVIPRRTPTHFVVKLLPLNDCRYALYDATYETKESKKEDLVFIFWCVKTKEKSTFKMQGLLLT